MKESDIDRVCTAVKRGARMMVGRDHAGRQKIKIVKGPFGLFVERFECTEEDLALIRARVAKDNSRKREKTAAVA